MRGLLHEGRLRRGERVKDIVNNKGVSIIDKSTLGSTTLPPQACGKIQKTILICWLIMIGSNRRRARS